MAKMKILMNNDTTQPDNSWQFKEERLGYVGSSFQANGERRDLPGSENSLTLLEMYGKDTGNGMENVKDTNGSLMTAPSWQFYNSDGTLNSNVNTDGSLFGQPRYSTLSVESGFDYRCTEGTGALPFALDPIVKKLCDKINPSFQGLAWGILKVDTFNSGFGGAGTTPRFYHKSDASEYFNHSSMWVYTDAPNAGDVRTVCTRIDGTQLKSLGYAAYGRGLRHTYVDITPGTWHLVESSSYAYGGTIGYNNLYMKNDKVAYIAFPVYTNGPLLNNPTEVGKGGN